MRSMKKQSGVSLFGLLAVGIIIIFVAYLGMKLIPVYMNNMKIAGALEDIAQEASIDKMSRKDISSRLEARFDTDFIKHVNVFEDLVQTKEDGVNEIRVDYATEVELMGNLNAVMYFENASYY